MPLTNCHRKLLVAILSLSLFVFFFCRVPTLCDFEPLNRHIDTLHQMVQAAQSVDEMSRTITDLLSEQRVMAVCCYVFID